ncbi:hypothetical protein MP228_009549 [Amoeboaphelidium protococcarum]|nr:hypothetical protein MP228_009549 [Amoeboaphelidium protococcarum]
MNELPQVIQSFLRATAASQPAGPPSYAAFLASIRQNRKKNFALLVVLLSSPWIYRYIKSRYEKTGFYSERRKRLESFAHHLNAAELMEYQEEDAQLAVDASKLTQNEDDPVAAEESMDNLNKAAQVEKMTKKKKQSVDKQFYHKLQLLLKIIVPRWRSKEAAFIAVQGLFLVLRTWLSVVVANIDGRIVKDIVSGNGKQFLVGLGYWFAIAVPATYTNSMIRYLQSKMAIAFRTRLTTYFHNLYFEDLIYYKLLNLDNRITGPDQLICNDVARFCDALASLYSNLAKPILDTAIFTYQLNRSIGSVGMAFIFVNYQFTAWLLRKATPGFGKLAAVEAKLEGDFRGAHGRLITNAEEIAFYDGGKREHGILDKTYKTLIRHVNRIFRIRIFYNMFEDFIIKYAWSAVGLLICSVPVFFPSLAGIAVSGDASNSSHGSRTQGFITNKRLMISLADAGGRIMYSYKEMAELAGFTSRVYELMTVLNDLKVQRYQKKALNASLQSSQENGTLQDEEKFSIDCIEGTVELGYNGVSLQQVPVVTPSGDLLVKNVNFDIWPGMHLMISGSNGVGKSAVMRVICGLWPVFKGKLNRPLDVDVVAIPQRPYLSIGSLRDQVIYPHNHTNMQLSGRTDEDLMRILEIVHLDYLPEREGGWDAVREWKDVLSGGEKQRMNLARLFYHRPPFAILDEATSAVSTDVEGLMYQRAQDFGITLITISHKPSLFKYHKYLLTLKGEDKSWEWTELNNDKAQTTVENEIKDLESRLQQEESMISRLNEINQLLGVKTNATKK